MASESAPRPTPHSKHSEAFPASKERERDTPTPEGANAGSQLAFHPLSLIILMIWLVYISVLIWLLERSTSAATTTYPQSWWNKRVSSLLLTGFAQGHAAVTAMHLARLAISALHHDNTSPRSWAELFWLADRSWQGPVSLGSALYDRFIMRPVPHFSTTFVLFVITCFIALPTPYVLQRGYDEGLLEVAVPAAVVVADTFSLEALPELNVWMQMSTGEGAWVTSLPITDIYNSSLFVPNDQARDDTAHDVVLAGSFIGMSVPALPSVRVQSDCDVYNGTIPGIQDSFSNWCKNIMPAMKYSDTSEFIGGKDDSVVARIGWCIDHDYNNTKWMSTSEASPVTAYIKFNATNSTQQATGMIKCTSSFSLGTAQADGRYNNFSSFTDTSDSVDTQLQHPLFAALYDLTTPFGVTGATLGFNGAGVQRVYSILNMIGYVPTPGSATNGGYYQQPTLEVFAARLRRGAMCMGAAIGALAKRPDQRIDNTIKYYAVSGRVRDPPYLWSAAGLLIAWFVMIVFCTVRMFRPTFGAALGSYSAGRLLVNDPQLVRSRPVGEMSDNRDVTKAFGRVGERSDSGTWHVAPGPELPKLSRGRSYGSRV